MSSFGEALASLYKEIELNRSERAKAASDRVEHIRKLARDTRNLLSGFAADQSTRAEEFKASTQALRTNLSASKAKLKEDITALKAQAQQEAQIRADRRAVSSKDLHTRLSVFADTLQKDIATQLGLARKAHVQAQNVQGLAESVVEKTVQTLIPPLKSTQKPSPKQDMKSKMSATPKAPNKKVIKSKDD